MQAMRSIDELDRLRYNEQAFPDVAVPAGAETAVAFDPVEPNVYELEVKLSAAGAAEGASGEGASNEAGIKVCTSPDGAEETVIAYDAAEGVLKIDTSASSPSQGRKAVESAPLKLAGGEDLSLNVFVDKSIVEVFANGGRLVLSRRVFPDRRDSVGIRVFAKGRPCAASVKAWDMMPTNPY